MGDHQISPAGSRLRSEVLGTGTTQRAPVMGHELRDRERVCGRRWRTRMKKLDPLRTSPSQKRRRPFPSCDVHFLNRTPPGREILGHANGLRKGRIQRPERQRSLPTLGGRTPNGNLQGQRSDRYSRGCWTDEVYQARAKILEMMIVQLSGYRGCSPGDACIPNPERHQTTECPVRSVRE